MLGSYVCNDIKIVWLGSEKNSQNWPDDKVRNLLFNVSILFRLLHRTFGRLWKLLVDLINKTKQAGTGPSRRHIYGSKIAKGHQSIKVFSSTAPENIFWSLTMPGKFWKVGPSGIFQHCVENSSKNWRGTLCGNNFFRKKVSQCRKNWKGEPFGLVRVLYATRGNLFGSVPWANGYNLASSLKFAELLG